ncbi:MAG: type II toxin-antitoxin system prevent-host-death family antitoxin [Lachnospiraceae bacterium]|nr:type II toxin-antitoxin system prevent-host-death family antitoxin [Lachnospiraceae bacterium]
MVEATATATEIKNQFGKYLQMIINGNEVIITKNGQEIGRIIPKEKTISYLTDSLTGIIKSDYDLDKVREESLKSKYEIND